MDDFGDSFNNPGSHVHKTYLCPHFLPWLFSPVKIVPTLRSEKRFALPPLSPSRPFTKSFSPKSFVLSGHPFILNFFPPCPENRPKVQPRIDQPSAAHTARPRCALPSVHLSLLIDYFPQSHAPAHKIVHTILAVTINTSHPG